MLTSVVIAWPPVPDWLAVVLIAVTVVAVLAVGWAWVLMSTDYTRRREVMTEEFRSYRRKQLSELRPYVPGEDMTGVSVSDVDAASGSPKVGDMIARNPKNHADRWLVSAEYCADNLELVE